MSKLQKDLTSIDANKRCKQETTTKPKGSAKKKDSLNKIH